VTVAGVGGDYRQYKVNARKTRLALRCPRQQSPATMIRSRAARKP
jgi:hypothetical protein